jgi:osmotically-inducible protein OsmY
MALLHSKQVDPSQLEVTVKDACVYLKGILPSKAMKRIAQDLVDSVPGVIDVFTQIKIHH